MKLRLYRNRIAAGIISLACLAGTVSCNDFLDVRPKSQIPWDLHFSREGGYFDQLTGVYTKMSGLTMYGTEMTFGLVELLAQNYNPAVDETGVYYNISRYDYYNAAVRAKIDTIWAETYNCIANLNIMLEYIDKADRKIFTGDNYYKYKGEALGLRAFLHFDMLRLYAPAYVKNPDAPGIPYVQSYGKSITRQHTVREAAELAVADLKLALECFEAIPDYTFDRTLFNKYSTLIMLARVYMYMGADGAAKALEYAEKIIAYDEDEELAIKPLGWVHHSTLESPQLVERHVLFNSEHAFRLSMQEQTMKDIVDRHFNSEAKSAAMLAPNEERLKVVYEDANSLGDDYRRQLWFASEGAKLYMIKYWQNTASTKMIPLIRKTEAYYIAAELYKNTNPQRAAELLNTVRANRNIGFAALADNMTPDQIQNEVFKEYRKEFFGEGQLFYYYKRLNIQNIEGSGVIAGDNVYVLPMPENEIDFGQRE